MLALDKEHIGKKSLLWIGVVFLLGLIASFVYYSAQSQVPDINTTTTSDVGVGGEVLINGNQESITTDSLSFQAKPGERIEFLSREIPAKEKANAAVLSWKQSGKDGVSLEVRTRNGDSWSPWTSVSADEPGKDIELADFSSTLILAKHIDNLQYRFKLTGTDSQSSSEIDLQNSKIVTIDSSSGPNENKSAINSLISFTNPVAKASSGPSPNIITRAEWGSPEPNWSSWPPEYAKLNRVILHHTATTESGDSYSDVRAIWQYHARTLGWGDIGYHYIIDSHGRIFEGRYHDKNHTSRNQVEVIGGHAYGNNVGTVGISMIGNYQHQQPSAAALESISHVTGYKLAPYGINPSGNGPAGEATIGHFQVYATECPGTNIINRFGQIKARATEYYQHYGANVGFSSMVQPRWMRLTKDTRKINVDTGQSIDQIIPAGTDVKYIDKYDRDGKIYLRTQHDYNASNRKAIALLDLADIQSEQLANPQWMTVVQNTFKVHPYTDGIYSSHPVYAGANVMFLEKITINNQTYYKTKRDVESGQNLYIKAERLKSAEYEPFIPPRYLEVPVSVNKYNPFTGEESAEVLPAGTFKFTSKITTDRLYFQVKIDEDSDSLLSIPADATRAINPINVESTLWMKLSKDTRKLNMDTLEPIGEVFKQEHFSSIKITQKVTIDGQLFYRTEHDTARSNPLVFAANDLAAGEIPYIPMMSPRTMTSNSDINIYDPRTGQIVGILNENTTQFYTSKIDIDGVTYVRNAEDSQKEMSRAVKLTDLR